jgi:hypothetical protein
LLDLHHFLALQVVDIHSMGDVAEYVG